MTLFNSTLPNIWYIYFNIEALSGCMKQNNRQRPDSKLLSLFSTWQQRHQTASVQLTAAAPAVMEHLRLASRQCLAGTSGDTGPVWAGTGALCPRHTWQCVTKAWHVPVSSGPQSGVWAPDQTTSDSPSLPGIPGLNDSCTHALEPIIHCAKLLCKAAKQRQAKVFKTLLKT